MSTAQPIAKQQLEREKQSFLGKGLGNVGLLLCSSLLFALSFPSFVSDWGWFPLAFFALAPIFIVIHRCSWIGVFIYGLFYGLVTYALFNFWLLKFHPLAIIIVPAIYAVYFFLLFPLLKIADTVFPTYGFLVQIVIWVAYEYLRTVGFLGYAYGIIGYSQYLFRPFIGISALFGVWGVSCLVITPSAFIGHAFKDGIKQTKRFWDKHQLEFLIYAVLFFAALVYGFLSKVDYSESKQWNVALIQHNVDPWKHNYEDALSILTRLSREATEHNPEIVIWSETAFVPAIEYHTLHRQNQGAYNLVRKLKSFLAEQKVPYVLGNDDGVLELVGGARRIDYNAALLFVDGEMKNRYRKVHLVPFTENFPYENQLPGIYNWLREADTHFWEKGEEFTVFEADGVRFSTPICFEDTFGYISREFVLNGAEVIVNLTNDSWSFSEAAMMQHMAMAVFRAVENRRTVVRSTNGGITSTIDPNGTILDMLAPFSEGYLISDVPVYTGETTLYTLFGDWFGLTAVGLAVALLAFGSIREMFRKGRRRS